MAEKGFRLKILTPDKTLFDGEVVSVTAPGKLGWFGVLAHHAPMITQLRSGSVKLRYPDGREEQVPIPSGFCKVTHDQVLILSD